MGQCEIGWALRPSARVLAQGQMSPCPTSHLGNYEQNDAKMPQNNSFLDATRKSRLLLVMLAPRTTKAMDRPLKLYLLPKSPTPTLLPHLRNQLAKDTCFLFLLPPAAREPSKALSEIFLAPANQFLLIKQSKGPGGFQKRKQKIF